VLGAVVAGSGALVYELRSEAEDIIRQLPEGARKLRRTLERNGQSQTSPITHVQQAATELEKAANGSATRTPAPPGVQRVQVESTPFRVSDYLLWGSLGVAEAATQLLMVLFLSFFLLASGDLHRRKLVKIVGPSLGKKKVTVQILEEISQRIESFLLVQLATSIIVGVATWLAFRWIGLQQAAVWGVLAGVFNSIPYFGPVIVTGGTATIAFLQFGTLSMALWTGAASLTITSLEGYLLTPWLTSRAARMNAVAVFVGLLFWGWVWNIWGLLLAVPMLMMIKVVCDHIEDFKPVGELMGD
jgi:predicted PurR-regulated permease PerM